MASKTIALQEEAYDRLKAAKRTPKESFTQVVLRAVWPKQTITARDLLARLRDEKPVLDDEDLDAIDDAKKRDRPPASKWPTR